MKFQELINFEKTISNIDENSIGIYVSKDIANLFKISAGEKLEIEAYWDEPNPIVNVTVLGFFSLSENESFNNFYSNNFMQEDSSFIFANFIIKDINELSKLGNKFVSMDSDLFWMIDIEEEKINSTEVSKINSIIVDSPPLLSSKYDNFSFKTGMVESLEMFDSNLSTAAIPMKTILILISVVIIFSVTQFNSFKNSSGSLVFKNPKINCHFLPIDNKTLFSAFAPETLCAPSRIIRNLLSIFFTSFPVFINCDLAGQSAFFIPFKDFSKFKHTKS